MEPPEREDPRALGEFVLLGRLGPGIGNPTFLARDAAGGLAVVSTVPASVAVEPGFAARFTTALRQQRSLAVLGPPWVPRPLAADPSGVRPWFATAYVAGLSLRRVVALDAPLPEPAARALGAVLARALAALHARGVAHAALTPSSLLVAADGVRLLSLGLTPGTATVTQVGVPATAYAWQAPEQLEGRAAGPPADVFALACLVAFAMTGRSPFVGDPLGVVTAVLAGRPSWSGVSRSLARDLEPCLAVHPDCRPHAADLVATLDPGDGTDIWTPQHHRLWMGSLDQALPPDPTGTHRPGS